MNKHVILLSAAAVLLFSCSREVDQAIQPGETITFTAAWAGADETRTILQSDGTSVWWDAAEQINVFFSDKASGKFTSTNSQPQAIVDFQGSLPIVVGSVETENPAHAYWAVYPYNTANTCDGESVTLTVPSTQTAKEGTFADKMFPSIATSTNFYLAFYNVCGGVRFTVANEEIASVTFKANNGESLAGKVKVGFEGVPVVKSVVEGVSEVVVNAPTGGFVPGKYYFAALLPQTLTKGVSLTFKKEDGKVASTSLDNSITINRSRFGKMEEKDKGLEFKDDGSGPNPSDNIEFADPKVKERLVAKFDSNGDGEISYAEAAAVTSIEGALTIKTITSFDEFQYFTGVTSIPDNCFDGWTRLTSITLPLSIVTIGNSAFNGCSSLQAIIIPANVRNIGERAFFSCSSLASIVVDPNNVVYDSRNFCDAIINTVSNSLLYGCKTTIIPNSVTSIEYGAFYGCLSLKSISIPESVSIIKGCAFYGCTSLKNISIPDSVSIIEGSSFSGCSSLESISLPESVTGIGESAFYECSNLVSVNTKEGINWIGNYAFYGCSSLVSINIPKSVTQIGMHAFHGCSSLESITIPEGVSYIEGATFKDCTSLKSISIPESVSIIASHAFLGCSNLESIIIPESVSKIGSQAFENCSCLLSITIPESVTCIESRAFFACSKLVSITVLPNTPPLGGSMMFENTYAPINVASNCVDAYKSAQYWSDYASRIQAIQ